MNPVRAPELEPYVTWLNTRRPLSIRALRGQLVILDFWTYCCVNCMHVVPVLRDLERRHRKDPLVVIGVHSAKFPTESDPDRVADAIVRYGIEHPVVVDREMGIWQKYGVRSWPTLVFVRPEGTIAAVAPGEPDPDMLERFVCEQLAQARQAGTLASEPIDLDRLEVQLNTTLTFPGKVAVAPDGRIAVSDSGNHRILVVTQDGRVQETIGSGMQGLLDGDFVACAFDHPQGVAWDGEFLWIADTGNHAIRKANLVTRQVTTVAGTGRMGTNSFRGRAPGRTVNLRSPWDLLPYGDRLFIAMAGAHQIWTLDKRTGEIGPFAGSGREALSDGSLERATFAQPSGLARQDETLFIVDSETSSVRALDLARGQLRTLVGGGLFDFGDTDGPLATARLQHPLGITVASDGALIVADTYNDRLRRIDLRSERVGTFYRGEGDGSLREPAGIATEPTGHFVIADAGHHRLVRVTGDGRWWEEIVIVGAPAPRKGELNTALTLHGTPYEPTGWFTTALEPDAGHALGEGKGVLSLTLLPPDGWKLADRSTAQVVIEVSRRSDLLSLEQDTVIDTVTEGETTVFVVTVEVERLPIAEIASEVLVTADAVLCTDKGTARCIPVRGWFRLPITLQRGGGQALGFNLPLPTPGE